MRYQIVKHGDRWYVRRKRWFSSWKYLALGWEHYWLNWGLADKFKSHVDAVTALEPGTKYELVE